jgi:hypothetical protein
MKVVVADINNDRKPHIVTASQGFGLISVLINTTPFPAGNKKKQPATTFLLVNGRCGVVFNESIVVRVPELSMNGITMQLTEINGGRGFDSRCRRADAEYFRDASRLQERR